MLCANSLKRSLEDDEEEAFEEELLEEGDGNGGRELEELLEFGE